MLRQGAVTEGVCLSHENSQGYRRKVLNVLGAVQVIATPTRIQRYEELLDKAFGLSLQNAVCLFVKFWKLLVSAACWLVPVTSTLDRR